MYNYLQILLKNGLKESDPKYQEFVRVKELAKQDIYTDILNYINNPELTRTDIKKHIMPWLFSKDTERRHNKNIIVRYIDEYFKFKFPNYAKFIADYKLTKSEHKLKSNTNKHKLISKLSIDCFEHESDLFFNNMIPNLNNSRSTDFTTYIFLFMMVYIYLIIYIIIL